MFLKNINLFIFSFLLNFNLLTLFWMIEKDKKKKKDDKLKSEKLKVKD